jgi:phospholipid transport system substrate-binding protein
MIVGLNRSSNRGVQPAMKRVLLSVLVLLSLAISGLVASAAPKKTATDAMKDANARLRGLLAKTPADQAPSPDVAKQVTHELRDLFDIGLLTQRALVDHWGDMSPAQRDELVSTLRDIVEKNYLSQLRSNLDYKIDYGTEEKQGDNVLVHTIIRGKKNGRPTKIKVDYRLVAVGDQWRVYDVITEDVSILDNYRSQFNRIIAKEGVPGLISRMKAKLDKAAP